MKNFTTICKNAGKSGVCFRFVGTLILLFTALQTDASVWKKAYDPEGEDHNGFQLSLFMGPVFGDVKGSTEEFGSLRFKGSAAHAQFHVGWAFNNWASGFSFGANSMSLTSVVAQNNTYRIEDDWTISGGLTGIYIKRYFMPLNIFLCGDFGVGTYVISDATESSTTERGFAWNIAVGKEFQLGQSKRFGLGGYFNLSGLKCKDVPPYQSDSYYSVLPGLGLVLSWH